VRLLFHRRQAHRIASAVGSEIAAIIMVIGGLRLSWLSLIQERHSGAVWSGICSVNGGGKRTDRDVKKQLTPTGLSHAQIDIEASTGSLERISAMMACGIAACCDVALSIA
jgi:hypothetical protein